MYVPSSHLGWPYRSRERRTTSKQMTCAVGKHLDGRRSRPHFSKGKQAASVNEAFVLPIRRDLCGWRTTKGGVVYTCQRYVWARPFEHSYLGRRHVPELYFPVGVSNQSHSISLFSSLDTRAQQAEPAQADEKLQQGLCSVQDLADFSGSVPTSATLV